MPIYEYQCAKCNLVFDYVHLKGDKEVPKCKKCGCSEVKKLVSRVRYLSGPKESKLASRTEERLLKSLGGKVSEKARHELKSTVQQAAKRGKKRFEKMMDTGSGESEDY